MRLGSRILLILILLFIVVFGGSAGFHFIEGWSWFDGFYMTLTTMTTVGSGEIHPLSHAGRVFNSFLIVAAVLSVGFTIATLSQALLQFEFRKAFGRRRMERELAQLSGHFIICGAGRVGRTVARELRARGVPDRHIEAAIAAVFAETDESALIRARLKRHLSHARGPLGQRQFAGLYRSLLRAGFSADVIRAELRGVAGDGAPNLPGPDEEPGEGELP